MLTVTAAAVAVAGWVAGSLGPRSHYCHCVVEGNLCALNEQVLGLLQGQLDRCGPAQLSCPPCPVDRRPEPRPCLAFEAFAGGVLLGLVLAAAAVWSCRVLLAGRTPSSLVVNSSVGVATPSQRRALANAAQG